MANGSGTVRNDSATPGRTAAQFVVATYDPDPSAVNFYNAIPNIEVIAITRVRGANPGSARFRYRLGNQIHPEWPGRFEDILGIDVVPSDFILAIDQRIVVLKLDTVQPPVDPGDPGFTVIFDGLAQVPQADVGGDVESVTFQAVGIASKLWETPVGGARWRNGPDTTLLLNTDTDRPVRFNPDDKANAVIKANWSDGPVAGFPDVNRYPVFLDPKYQGGIETATGRTFLEAWTISSAVRYLLATGNPPPRVDPATGAPGPVYVTNPDCDLVDVLLDREDDPADLGTVVLKPIEVEDYDATGDPMPVAIEKLLGPYKRGFYFDLSTKSDGRPLTKFVFYRTDNADPAAPKDVYLDAPGGLYDPTTSNASAINVHRDCDNVVNKIILNTEAVRYECSFVLAPGFRPDVADVTTGLANKDQFTEGDPRFTGPNIDKYRLLVFDESGEGHWEYGSDGNGGSWKKTATSLDDLFGDSETQPGDTPGTPKTPRYARRRRPGIGPLFTADELGTKLSPQLWVSANYTGKPPGIWDGTGDWQKVAGDCWNMTDDRLGIRFTIPQVYNISIGECKDWTGTGDPPTRSGKFDSTGLMGVFAGLVGPAYGLDARLSFRLTCVVESDRDMRITSGRNAWSASAREIVRRIDAKDRFVKHIISAQSHLNTFSSVDVDDRNDTADAQDYADAMVAAHECGSISGSVTIPFLTLAYGLTDPIRQVKGRDVSFRVNMGAPEGTPAEFPTVTAITLDLDGAEQTTLHIASDQADPPVRRRR